MGAAKKLFSVFSPAKAETPKAEELKVAPPEERVDTARAEDEARLALRERRGRIAAQLTGERGLAGQNRGAVAVRALLGAGAG